MRQTEEETKTIQGVWGGGVRDPLGIVRALLHLFPFLSVCMYVCSHTYSKSMDQPGKVTNSARGQLNREK